MEKINFEKISDCVFDFGNVIAEYDPIKLTSACLKDDRFIKTVSDIVFDRLYWDALDKGDISDQEVKEAFCLRLPEQLRAIACEIYDRWVENLTLIDGMEELLQRIKASGRGLYLLSNISRGFVCKYPQVPHIQRALSLFDGLVFSGCIGVTKPDERIYRYLLERFSLNSGDCLFVDDREENIEAALSVGMHGFLFTSGAEGLSRAIFG